MHRELKKAIFMWLLNNENRWNRINNCVNEFRAYIYDSKGNYLIGGEDVYDFILGAERLIYGKSYGL